MERLLAQKLEYFGQLLTCGQNLYCWEYDPALNLVGSNCPQAAVIGSFLDLGGCRDYLVAYLQKGETKPLVLSDELGLSWIVAFEAAAGQLCRVHMIGPAFTSAVSSKKLEQQLASGGYSQAMRQLFNQQVQQLPLIQPNAWFQFGLMLHYTVTNEKIFISDFNYQAPCENPASEGMERRKTPKAGTWLDEQRAMQMIEEGRLDYQQDFERLSMSANYSGFMADDAPLPKIRSAVMVFVALCTRAALRGGLDAETAYYVGEYYTNAAEEATTLSELMRLNSTAYDDFVRRVHRCRAAQGVSAAIQACCNYIDLHLSEELSLGQLAAIAGYSEYYLAQKFKKEMGVSPARYIKQQKIERAKQLLRNTQESIQNISESLGFCNHSYFTETFRSLTGVSPGEFRANGGARQAR